MPKDPARIFFLSPAKSTGKRTDMLLNPRAVFPLAVRVRKEGAPIGEVFSFLSGLYFRGKLAYSQFFARGLMPGVWIITSNRGLLPADTVITAEDLRAFGEVPIDPSEKRYIDALRSTAM